MIQPSLQQFPGSAERYRGFVFGINPLRVRMRGDSKIAHNFAVVTLGIPQSLEVINWSGAVP
jgi:hypothetical protein